MAVTGGRVSGHHDDDDNGSSIKSKEKVDDGKSGSSGDGDDSDDEIAPSPRRDYFLATAGIADDCQHWFCGLFKFLGLSDSGGKDKRASLQHCSQGLTLLESINAWGKTLDVLAEEGGDVVWMRWVKPHLDHG